MNLSIDAIQANIQLALAPVFLLTAVATLVTAITARLAVMSIGCVLFRMSYIVIMS